MLEVETIRQEVAHKAQASSSTIMEASRAPSCNETRRRAYRFQVQSCWQITCTLVASAMATTTKTFNYNNKTMKNFSMNIRKPSCHKFKQLGIVVSQGWHCTRSSRLREKPSKNQLQMAPSTRRQPRSRKLRGENSSLWTILLQITILASTSITISQLYTRIAVLTQLVVLMVVLLVATLAAIQLQVQHRHIATPTTCKQVAWNHQLITFRLYPPRTLAWASLARRKLLTSTSM